MSYHQGATRQDTAGTAHPGNTGQVGAVLGELIPTGETPCVSVSVCVCLRLCVCLSVCVSVCVRACPCMCWAWQLTDSPAPACPGPGLRDGSIHGSRICLGEEGRLCTHGWKDTGHWLSVGHCLAITGDRDNGEATSKDKIPPLKLNRVKYLHMK